MAPEFAHPALTERLGYRSKPRLIVDKRGSQSKAFRALFQRFFQNITAMTFDFSVKAANPGVPGLLAFVFRFGLEQAFKIFFGLQGVDRFRILGIEHCKPFCMKQM